MLAGIRKEQSLRSSQGQTLVEYAFVLVLVALLCVAGLSTIGSETNRLLPELSNAIAEESGD